MYSPTNNEVFKNVSKMLQSSSNKSYCLNISAANLYFTMESTVPLLTPEQIEELNNMIHGISEENKKKLDDILSETVDVEKTSIMGLYKLVVEQWEKKQKIIDNLCHFSLTMMATVHLLWDQKYEQEEKLSTAEVVIDNLQKHIDELGTENEKIKVKINEAQTHIESISGEKQKFQELYRSQSCCNFADEGYFSDIQVFSQISKQCQACGQHKSLLQKQKDDFIKETSVLKQQKKQLQKKFEQLMQEHKLVKMEIQLAQIAVKDALSYRESSISNRSEIMNRSDEIYTTKSHAQFMNGDLQCFSNLDQSFNYERKQILSNQIFADQQNICHFVSTPQLPSNDMEQTDLKLANTQEQTMVQSPFKKKISKNIQERRYYTETNEKVSEFDDCLRTEVKQVESKFVKDKKTVSLQCNLIKNVPKIKLFSKKPETKTNQQDVKPQAKNQQLTQRKKQKKVLTIQSQKNLSKSEITKPNIPSTPQQSSIGKFISFISSKVITNRIKVK